MSQYKAPVTVVFSEHVGRKVLFAKENGQMDLTIDEQNGHTLSISAKGVTMSLDLASVLKFIQESAGSVEDAVT